jgi:hypothetical protein
MIHHHRFLNRIAILLLFVFVNSTASAQNDTTATSSSEPAGKSAHPKQAVAQTDSTQKNVVRITLTDGSELLGTIDSQDALSIKFRTLAGVTMEIPLSSVKKTERIGGQMVRGQFFQSDPNQTRLFFAPTAKGLAKGQGYYSVYEVFFPFVAYGLTDFLTLAGGMTLVPGAKSQVVYFAPRLNLPPLSKNFNLAGGVLYFNSTSFEAKEPIGIAYGVGTVGPSDRAFTVGLGWGFAGSNFADNPILMLGGELRTGRYTKLITENWFPTASKYFVYSFGVRFFGENLAADFGMIGSSEQSTGFPFIPWLGFAYNFGTSNIKAFESEEDQAAPSSLEGLEISCSIGLPAFGPSKQYEDFLDKQGFQSYGDGLFDSYSGTKSSAGNSMTFQAKFFINDRFAIGGMIKTLGGGIGSDPELVREKSFEGTLANQQLYYYSTSLKIKYSVVGYYLTGSYVLLPPGSLGSTTYLTISGGIGNNTIKTDYSTVAYNYFYWYGSTEPNYFGTRAATKQVIGYYLNASLEQWITSSITFGLSGSYTSMPAQTIDQALIPAGTVTVYNYQTSKDQTIPVDFDLIKHTIDFNYVAFSIEVGWHF